MVRYAHKCNACVRIKYLMLVLDILVLNLVFSNPLAAQIVPATSPESRAISDTIIMGALPNYPPYCFTDEQGNITGFAVDIFFEAARAAGYETKILLTEQGKIRNAVRNGVVDAFPIIGRLPERERYYDFSLAYLSLNGAVFVRKNDDRIKTYEDLKGKEIMVMKNDNAELFITRKNITDKIFTTSTIKEAFLNLESGRHDAVVIDELTGFENLKELGVNSIVALDIQIPDFRIDYCFGVKNGNTELLARLNEGLSIIIANDVYRDIYYKWFGLEIARSKNIQNAAKTILIVLIPLILGLIIAWIYFLRKEVNKRTQWLNKEIEEHKNTLKNLADQQSRLKDSEEQIRLLLDSTAEGLYAIDSNGNCIIINNSALRILGFSTQEEILGKNMHQLIHYAHPDGSAYEAGQCVILKSSKQGTGTHRDDEVFWKADGTSFPAEYYSYPIRQNGIITGSVVTFLDITERKKAENELIQLQKQLEEKVTQRTAELADKVQKLDRSQRAMLYMVEDLNQITSELKQQRTKLEAANYELEAFTYSVSHDLRAPLRAINGFSDYLLEDYADIMDDAGKQFIKTIHENATKMDKLITDLLNLSRVSRTNLNVSKTDMKQLAQAILHETLDDGEKNSYDVKVSDLPSAFCDAGLTKQVWHNLIGNALKYSSKSEIKKIEIGASEDTDEVVYYVKDSGIGFDEKFKDKIFGVFQRLHRENEFEGTGVGLAIVQRIVQRQGGRVWAEGTPGKGATFYFTLPSRQKKMVIDYF